MTAPHTGHGKRGGVASDTNDLLRSAPAAGVTATLHRPARGLTLPHRSSAALRMPVTAGSGIRATSALARCNH